MKKEIRQYLLSKGFKELEEDVFEYISKQVQQMVINGQPIQHEISNKLIIKYIGEGYIDDKVIYGYSIYQNDEHIIDEYIDGLEQFRRIL